jgi:hypothetical protein
VLQAHVADLHAGYRAVVVEQGQRRGETGEHVDTQRLRLGTEPGHEPAERDDEIPFVAQVARDPRHAARAPASEPQELVTGHRHLDGQRCIPPFGQQGVQRTGLEHGTRQDVRADRGSFLQHAHRQFGLALLEADRRGEPGGPTADHGDVVLHHIALRGTDVHGLLGLHANGAIEPDGLAVEVGHLEDRLHHGREFLGPPETRRKRHLFPE